jgi:hypothetical protein
MSTRRQLDRQRHLQELPPQVAAVQDLPLLAELLAVGGGDHEERAVPLSAGPEGSQETAQPIVGPGHVEAVHGPEPPFLPRWQVHGGIEERGELMRQDAVRQVEAPGFDPGRELRTLEVGRLRLGDVDPDELPSRTELPETLGGFGALAEVLQRVESLSVAGLLEAGGVAGETGGLVAGRLHRLGQGEEAGREAGAAVEDLVLPGPEAGEQGGHAGDSPARGRDGPAPPVGAAKQEVEVRRQALLAAQRADHVGPQGVEGDEDDRALVRRFGAAARGEEERQAEEEEDGPGAPLERERAQELTRRWRSDRAGGSCPRGPGSA